MSRAGQAQGCRKWSGYEVGEGDPEAARGDGILLIALSGYSQAEDKRKALDSGFDAHLSKPVDLDTVTRLLNELEQFHRHRTLR